MPYYSIMDMIKIVDEELKFENVFFYFFGISLWLFLLKIYLTFEMFIRGCNLSTHYLSKILIQFKR